MSRSSSAALARSSLTGLLRDAARLDRTQSDPVVSGRNAVGVAIPMVIGILAGNPSLGLAMTIGALQAAFADRPGPYRLRMLRMLGTAVAAAITSTLAVLCSRSDVASVALLLVLAFVAGLLTAGGPAATQVGIASVAAALLLGHLQQPVSVAPHVGLLVLAGGAIQTTLAVAGWPLRRHRPERVALARLYRELAIAARTQPGTSRPPVAGDALTNVRNTLYGLGHDHGPSVEAYRVLLDEAERIRREIVVVSAAAERLDGSDETSEAGLVRKALESVAGVLDEIGDALDEGRPVREELLDCARGEVRRATDRLTARPGEPGELTRQAGAARLRALSGQVRAAVESTRAGASEGRREEPADAAGRHVLRDPVEIVRANLTLHSAVFRHAVRLGLVVAAGDAVVRAAGLDRGYWVPLTLLVVLRPDFATTWQRAGMRMVGTIVGLLLATALVAWLPGGQWWHVLLIALFAFGMRFAGPGNIALTAVCLSGLVVVLLEVQGVPAHTTVTSRAIDTVIGGTVAVLAVALLLPSWERQFVPDRLVDLLGAYRRYCDVVADLHADRTTIQRARAACRLARSNAQSSVDRAAAEPVTGQRQVELGRAVLAHTHRFIHAMLSIDAVRVPLREAGGLPPLAAFLSAAGDVLDAMRTAIRQDALPGTVTALRPLQEELAAAATAEQDRIGVDTASVLIEGSDRVANSIDTLVAELRRQLEVTSPP